MSFARRSAPRRISCSWRGVALVASLALLLPAVINAPPASALMKAHCKPEVGRGNFDPVVHHGMMPMSHNHTFFANTKLLTLPDPNSATYSQLAGAGTTCQNPDDTASYWIPTLLFRAT